MNENTNTPPFEVGDTVRHPADKEKMAFPRLRGGRTTKVLAVKPSGRAPSGWQVKIDCYYGWFESGWFERVPESEAPR